MTVRKQKEAIASSASNRQGKSTSAKPAIRVRSMNQPDPAFAEAVLGLLGFKA